MEADRVTLGVDRRDGGARRYGLWLDGGGGHARVGDILDVDTARPGDRRLEGVDCGRLTVGFARWNQYYYAGSPPGRARAADRDVRRAAPSSATAGLAVPGDPSAAGAGDRWAILVHGRGARREECLRAVPVTARARLHDADPHVPQRHRRAAGPDGRYNLGLPSGATSRRR